MQRTILIIVALVAIVGGGWWMFSDRAAPGGQAGAETAQPADAADIDTSGIVDMQMGNPDAAVTVIEYASFTCPHCATFNASVFPQLKANYIDTGKINFIHREVYFDRYALWAGMVARCGGPERYFGIADMIYTQQQQWLAGTDPLAISAGLQRIGRTAGLSDEEVTACLNDGATAQAMVAVYEANAAADDVRATPSFVINGEKHSNMSYAAFAEILDKELGE
ncbi:MAG: DsbA family protein [Paracoccaceae bacterium]